MLKFGLLSFSHPHSKERPFAQKTCRLLSSIYVSFKAGLFLIHQLKIKMATQLKYENGMLIPEGTDYPPVEMLFNSANRNYKINRVLNRKRNSGPGLVYTLLILLAAVNTILTITVAFE